MQGMIKRMKWEDGSDENSWRSGGELHPRPGKGGRDWVRFNYISEEKDPDDR